MKKKWSLCPAIVASLLLVIALAACGPTSDAGQPDEGTTEPTVVSGEPTPKPTATAAAKEPMPEPTATEIQTTEDEAVEEDIVETASGLQYVMIKEGDGPAPQAGEIVAVHYRGTLEDGTEFDSSYGREEPFAFPLGQGFVIPGWDEGIALLKVGGQAKLIIPPELGYGDRGAGGVIPPGATLIFEVELVDILPGAPAAPTEVDEEDYVTTDSGLKYYDLEVGEGPMPEAGQQVIVHYTGWLTDGTKFDSSLDRGQPFSFVLSAQQVIPGWDEGLSSMNVGGQRQLVIPPELAYGSQGAGGVIPPNATLLFEVELLGVR